MKRLIILFAIIISTALTSNLFSQINDEIYTPIPGTERSDTVKTIAKSFRDPVIATALSFLYPGIGQFYNGQNGKAVGYMLWGLTSNFVMGYSFIKTFEYMFSDKYNTYPIIYWCSFASSAAAWILGMVDANLSAKKINKYNGFVNIDLGNNKNLSIYPDIKFVPQPHNTTTQTLSPSFGLNLSLSF